MKNLLTVRNVLWLIYFALLGVLLPHLAWAAEQFEPQGGKVSAWAFAITFELVIAVFTHKLHRHIEEDAKRKGKRNVFQKFYDRYVNPFSIGLVFFVLVSALGNLTHAWEFGRERELIALDYIPFGVYAVAFGASLPFANLLFARVLSEVTEAEDAPNPELLEAKTLILSLRKQVKETEANFARSEEARRQAEVARQETEAKFAALELNFAKSEESYQELRNRMVETEVRLTETELARQEAEAKFSALGEKVQGLFSETKRERIVTAFELWQGLPGKSIAVIAGTTEGHVSEVLKEYRSSVMAEA
jgi:hypothetical protein